MKGMIPVAQVFINEAKLSIGAVQLPPHVRAVREVVLVCNEYRLIASHGNFFGDRCLSKNIGEIRPRPAMRPERFRGLMVVAFGRLPCERQHVEAAVPPACLFWASTAVIPACMRC